MKCGVRKCVSHYYHPCSNKVRGLQYSAVVVSFHSRLVRVCASFLFGLLFYHFYEITGLAVIISKSILLFSIVKYLGAAYLIYIGWKTFKTRNDLEIGHVSGSISALSAFKEGFITNALNPKTTIFFLSLFTQVVSPETPLVIQVVYGAIISMAHLLWFSCVSIYLTQPKLLALFQRSKRTIEKLVGGVLIAFGIKVAAS